MTHMPANDDRDLWAITGAMLAALLRTAWSSRRRERPLNGSAGAPGDESGMPATGVAAELGGDGERGQDEGGPEAPTREFGD